MKGRANCVEFYTIPYYRARAFGVASPNAGKHNISCRKESYSVCDHLVRKSRLTAIRWKYLYSSSVGLHIIALILIRRYLFWFAGQLNLIRRYLFWFSGQLNLIRRYLFWFYFLRYERIIESKNLPDKVTNLGIFTIWLASSGCLPHTSSVWPWSGAP